MSITTSCPNPDCGKQFRVSKDTVGRTARCKACGTRFRVAAGRGELVSGSSNSRKSKSQESGKASAEVPRPATPSPDGVPADWNIGDVIVDLYEVTGLLGEGGMGKVYKVHHKGWNMDLAVKSPRQELLQEAGAIENFEQEAETWVNLGLSPHIASCHYVRTLGGIPRVFAEYVAGGSLKEWIDEGQLYEGAPQDSLRQILDIAIQFAWGLHVAHEKGLIHQDVKPANVLMTADGTAKVTDFGLAKARAVAGATMSRSHGQSILVSSGGMTPAYCSPEQANGEKLTRKTDIWSWAVSVLEMFAGDVTWQSGVAAREALEAYLEMGPDDDSLPAMPNAVAELLRQCLQQDPDQRPATMADVTGLLCRHYEHEIGQPYARAEPKDVELLADSLNNRAISLLDLGQQEEAERVFAEAFELDPSHPASIYNRGLLWWRSGRMTDDALVQQLEQSRQNHPDDWRIDLMLAQVHLERDDCESAVTILEQIKVQRGEKQQEIEKLLSQARARLPTSRRCVRTFEEHTNTVNSVCLSPDDRYAIAATETGLQLCNVTGDGCQRAFESHRAKVVSVCCSPDGRYALSAGAGMYLWDVVSGRKLRTFEKQAIEVTSVCFSPDGRFAVSGNDIPGSQKGRTLRNQTLKLWEVSSGRCVRTFKGHRGIVVSVCFSPDGHYALSAAGRTLKLWRVSSGYCEQTFHDYKKVGSACLSPQGVHVISGGADNRLTLWHAFFGDRLRSFVGHTSTINSVCFSPDGRYVLSGSADKTLRLWDVSSGCCLRTLETPAIVNSVCFCRDNGHAVSGTQNHGPKRESLKLWNAVGNHLFGAPWEQCRVIRSEAASQVTIDYQRLVCKAKSALSARDAVAAARALRSARQLPGCARRNESLAIWTRLYKHLPSSDLSSAWEMRTFKGHDKPVTSVCFTPDGRYALSASATEESSRTLRLWDLPSGQCLRTFRGHTSSATSACLSSDGQYALSGSHDKTLKLWNLSTGQCLRTFEGHDKSVKSVCLSPDSRYALSISDPHTLKMWEVSSGRCLRTYHGINFFDSMCFSLDGCLLWGQRYGAGTKLELGKIFPSGRGLQKFEGHRYPVTSLCVSGDARYILSGSTGISPKDEMLKLWEVSSGRCVRTFDGHMGCVNSVCLSGDGHYALSASSDKTIKLWEVASGRCLRTFEGHTDEVSSVCLSPDGRYLLSGSHDKTLKLWALDWELEDRSPADWDDGARPYLEVFLSAQTPYGASLPVGREPTQEEITLALTRRGKPVWNEVDFQRLLDTLGCAGYGWLRPEGVRRKLDEMAAEWTGPPPLATEERRE